MKKEREYLVKEGDVKDPPIHPGEIIGEDVLPALNMSVAEAAKLGPRRAITGESLPPLLT